MDVVWFGDDPAELPSSEEMQERPPAEFRKELESAGFTAAAPQLGDHSTIAAQRVSKLIEPEDLEVYTHWFSLRCELGEYTCTPPPELPGRVQQIKASAAFDHLMVWVSGSGEALLVGQLKRESETEAIRWGVISQWNPSGHRTAFSTMRNSYRRHKAFFASVCGLLVLAALAATLTDVIDEQQRTQFLVLLIIVIGLVINRRGRHR